MSMLIADSWSHIFQNNKKRTVRFCLDTDSLERKEGVRAFVSIGIKDSKGWRMAFRAEGEDVLDSLVNGNPGLIDTPEQYGIQVAEKVPDWVNDVRGRALI